MPASRGTQTARVRSGIIESATVGIPLASRTRWTSPTDRQQNGQAGEVLHVSERLVVSPTHGVFHPAPASLVRSLWELL